MDRVGLLIEYLKVRKNIKKLKLEQQRQVKVLVRVGDSYSEALAKVSKNNSEEKVEVEKQKSKFKVRVYLNLLKGLMFKPFKYLLMLMIPYIIILVLIIGVFFAVIIGVNNILNGEQVDALAPISQLRWNLSELDARGSGLTANEKNIYRLILLGNAYGDGSLTGKIYGKDIQTTMLLGISSVETGMRFYVKEEGNILKNPSDINENSSGYGMYGIHSTSKLNGYFEEYEVNAIKGKYRPTVEVSDNRYAPYAVPIALKHLESKKNVVDSQNIEDKVIEIAASYGIYSNINDLTEYCKWSLALAGYHGYAISKYDGYLGFLIGMWAASSDIDSQRSINNYSYQGITSYAEGGIRQLYIGRYNNNYKDFGTESTISWRDDYTPRMAVDGQVIDKPIWQWLLDKYPDNEYLQLAYNQVITQVNQGGGVADRILNYHYGPNAYIVTNQIKKDLTIKMGYRTITQIYDVADNHTIKAVYGQNTIQNLLTTAMQPVGRVMYLWGGGREKWHQGGALGPIGVSPKWLQFYEEQRIRGVTYYFREFTTLPVRTGEGLIGSPTDLSRSSGLDCSGFVGWVVQNTRGDGDAYIYGAGAMGGKFKEKKLGTLTSNYMVVDYRPGDIMYKSGHVYMIVGPSEHGGVVLVHASPSGVKLGGFGGGEKTAQDYMSRYWPDVANRSKPFNFSWFQQPAYEGQYNQFRWYLGGNGITDPEGFYDMSAEQILKILFQE